MDWIDTHCHLDAPEFDDDREAVLARARQAGVRLQVLPAVGASQYAIVSELAARHRLAYAMGIHPLYVDRPEAGGLTELHAALQARASDPRLVAVGEIGLDAFVATPAPSLQLPVFQAQLALAQRFGLPVILHVRRSADEVLRELRRTPVVGGIAHAFNGSLQQAQAFIDRGFKLGFGGAMSFERALQIRRLAAELPLEALVLETDAPDIPPHWLYKTAAERAAGARSRNEPAELPRIAQVLADLRGLTLEEVRAASVRNACAALPRLTAHLGTDGPDAPGTPGPAPVSAGVDAGARGEGGG